MILAEGGLNEREEEGVRRDVVRKFNQPLWTDALSRMNETIPSAPAVSSAQDKNRKILHHYAVGTRLVNIKSRTVRIM